MERGLKAAKVAYRRRHKGTGLISYLVNNRAYELKDEHKIELALALFQINVYAFPKSADNYDSLAEGYMDKGEKALAIKYYEKSLALNPRNVNAVETLKKLH